MDGEDSPRRVLCPWRVHPAASTLPAVARATAGRVVRCEWLVGRGVGVPRGLASGFCVSIRHTADRPSLGVSATGARESAGPPLSRLSRTGEQLFGGGQGAKRLRGERACAEHEHEERCPCADAVRERGTTSVQASTSRTALRASGWRTTASGATSVLADGPLRRRASPSATSCHQALLSRRVYLLRALRAADAPRRTLGTRAPRWRLGALLASQE